MNHMTLDNLIGKLQEIRKNHPGDIKVELVSKDDDFDYGEEEPFVEVAVQIGFTAENYD